MSSVEVDSVEVAAQLTLKAAARGQRELAAAGLSWINSMGSGALTTATQIWIDLHTEHATGGCNRIRNNGDQMLTMYDVRTAELINETADDTPAEVRWSMRAIRARATGDRGEFENALIDLPHTEELRAACLVSLLMMCAQAITSLPYGYAACEHPTEATTPGGHDDGV